MYEVKALRILLNGALVAGLLGAAPAPAASAQGKSGTGAMSQRQRQQAEIAQRYRAALEAWKKYVGDPRRQFSSNTADYTRNPAYDQIVSLGKAALPFLMADLERGEFMLNDAAHRITGIDVTKIYPGEKMLSEQDLSKFWVRWWSETGKKTFSSKAQL
jgi:hypothetical protein